MLSIMKTLAFRYTRYMTLMGRIKAREVLLRCNDRQLEDVGISRQLLEQGISAWPWHSSGVNSELAPIEFEKLKARDAVRELNEYSDVELHDLGITRGTINEAVRFGREGIERYDERKVA